MSISNGRNPHKKVENARKSRVKRKTSSSRDHSEAEEDEPLEKKPALELVREVDLSKPRTRKRGPRVRKGQVKVQEPSMKKAEIVDDPMEDIDCDDIKVDCADIETESVDNQVERDGIKAASVDSRIDGVTSVDNVLEWGYCQDERNIIAAGSGTDKQ